ncbi:hypothetical protein [Paraglaciecola arctica]|uniref:hypothetical protein n=1 Tax=Paraglaciecola arctica TaxID=1128911 RepID=UPI001C06B082|nr:hypothetical protein [Paraglaciecola arctica]MBU3002295.1 hypothetical protein [Paraglaciecola arctica]
MTLKSTFYELVKIRSMNSWKLNTKNKLVKVVTSSSNVGNRVGYVTQEKYIVGLTALQIERDLGLKPKMLAGGAKIYELLKLPELGEFECKLSTCFPGGSVFEWKDVSDLEFESRDFWPPGKGFPQWDITVSIPTRLIRTLLAHEPY